MRLLSESTLSYSHLSFPITHLRRRAAQERLPLQHHDVTPPSYVAVFLRLQIPPCPSIFLRRRKKKKIFASYLVIHIYLWTVSKWNFAVFILLKSKLLFSFKVNDHSRDKSKRGESREKPTFTEWIISPLQ